MNSEINKPLYELIYQSFASENFDDHDILDLLHLSKTNNEIHEVTGCLFYHERTFIQVIEGSKFKIEQLYKNIKNDPRNQKVELMWDGYIKERGFKTWALSYLPKEDLLKQNKELDICTDFIKTGKLKHEQKGVQTIGKSLLLFLRDGMVA